jgi:hypothetical protein
MALFDNNPLYENISSLTNPVTSGLGNLFGGMNVFGAKQPEYLGGLLTTDQQEKLKNQALLSGLIGAGATYFAQPNMLKQWLTLERQKLMWLLMYLIKSLHLTLLKTLKVV